MSQAVAKRYAEALFQLKQEKGKLDQLTEEAKVLKSIFNEHNRFVTFLEHPRIDRDKKMQFLDNVFPELSGDVLKTLKLLVIRHRTALIPYLMEHVIHFVNDANDIAEATVYSVRELTNKEKEQLENTFAKRFNKQAVTLETVVDSSVIGGLKLRIGNTIYDGTIQGKLKRMQERIEAANE